MSRVPGGRSRVRWPPRGKEKEILSIFLSSSATTQASPEFKRNSEMLPAFAGRSIWR